ncbi:hypothetical protein Y032_0031g2294 [Ancylostoma ceylanicum]|uniref:Uncharacterized protein n=1 Tax=Ancylostoma ceylanicum TaxID=53326 RepID=A0A016UPQ6_9BILA|nr:hypothetical protein Y032_0031g2294 [Ancylostoma ceylanicum]
MKLVLLISVAVTVVHCKGPVFVEELEGLVKTKNEKLALRSLAEDVYMLRPLFGDFIQVVSGRKKRTDARHSSYCGPNRDGQPDSCCIQPAIGPIARLSRIM